MIVFLNTNIVIYAVEASGDGGLHLPVLLVLDGIDDAGEEPVQRRAGARDASEAVALAVAVDGRGVEEEGAVQPAALAQVLNPGGVAVGGPPLGHDGLQGLEL